MDKHQILVVHGIFMLLAWGVFAQIGVLIATCTSLRVGVVSRYFTTGRQNKRSGFFHFLAGAGTCALTLIGFGIASVEVGGLVLDKAHNILGTLVVVLVVLQVCAMLWAEDEHPPHALSSSSSTPTTPTSTPRGLPTAISRATSLTIAPTHPQTTPAPSTTTANAPHAGQWNLRGRLIHRVLGRLLSFLGLYTCLTGTALLAWSPAVCFSIFCVVFLAQFAMVLLSPTDMHEQVALGFDVVKKLRSDSNATHNAALLDFALAEASSVDDLTNDVDLGAAELQINDPADIDLFDPFATNN